MKTAFGSKTLRPPRSSPFPFGFCGTQALRLRRRLSSLTMRSGGGHFIIRRVFPRLISPFAGQHPMEVLTAHTATLTEVKEGQPRLIAIRGWAGSGKSRLAEELRDEAQHREFVAKMVRFERGADNHREIWRSFF